MKTFTTFFKKNTRVMCKHLVFAYPCARVGSQTTTWNEIVEEFWYLCLRELMSRKAFSDRVINILLHASLRSMP